MLRDWFSLWGLPGQLRLDNGWPWGGWFDLPTELALWVAGLGVGLVFNPPRTPQDNGVVERSQGTGKRWADPGRCRDAAQLQERLGWVDQIQREHYPSVGGQSRLAAYPGLAHSGRPYSREGEQAAWSEAGAKEYLAGFEAQRQVDSQGRIRIYYRNVYVGAKHKGQLVRLNYDPEGGLWVLRLADRHLRDVPAPEICRERIMSLTVASRPSCKTP